MKLLMVVFSVLLVMILGCTDSQIGNFTSIGSSAKITCYSGDKVIYEGHSTGKVTTVTNSDGWEFKDSDTGKFVRVSGPCVILN